MSSHSKVIKRYSLAFKHKVISEIESGRLSISEARKLYGITGGQTIQSWLKKMGKNHLINKVVHIQNTDEVNQLKNFKRENQRLESALAQAHLRIVSLESMLEKASDLYGTDLKKKYDIKV